MAIKKITEFKKQLNKSKLFNKLYNRDFDEKYLYGIQNEVARQSGVNITGDFLERDEYIDFRKFITAALEKHMKIVSYHDIKIWTSDVYTMDYKSLEDLVAKYTGDDKLYIEDQYKCGHFSIDFIDYASEITLNNKLNANLALGMLAFYWTTKENRRLGHALNWVVTKDKNVYNLYTVEPQTGTIRHIDEMFEIKEKYGSYDFELELFLML